MITLEEAYSRASTRLRKKMEKSVALLQKAERLAMQYDPQDGYFLAFSGGKDSQALYHMTELAGVKFRGHMNLTSVDPPEVIRFVRQQYPDVEMVKPKDSIYNIAIQRGILPTMRARWCCAEFKETAGAGRVTLIGIRHAESTRRAKRKEVEISEHKFKGTLEELDEYRAELKEKRAKKRSQKEQGVNITNATEEQTVGCIHGKESLLISPIIEWTESDVWEFLNNVVKVPHCCLYDQGWHRIGCINCPMASAKQKVIENKRWPHVRRNWIKAIMKIRAGGVLSDKAGSDANQNSYQKDIWRQSSDPAAVWGGGTETSTCCNGQHLLRHEQSAALHQPIPDATLPPPFREGYIWWNIPATMQPTARIGSRLRTATTTERATRSITSPNTNSFTFQPKTNQQRTVGGFPIAPPQKKSGTPRRRTGLSEQPSCETTHGRVFGWLLV